ncbi:MAG TPA: hypothetical protein VFG22_17150, partial [Polyangiales bacterium]|nr:hypothetical protein [Polyangiales bacterium]
AASKGQRVQQEDKACRGNKPKPRSSDGGGEGNQTFEAHRRTVTAGGKRVIGPQLQVNAK